MKYFYIVFEFTISIILLSIVFGSAIPKGVDNKPKNMKEYFMVNPTEVVNKKGQLSPKGNATKVVARIVDNIDSDGDGLVTSDELKQWSIKQSVKKYIKERLDEEWKVFEYDDNKVTQISWNDYMQVNYGMGAEEMATKIKANDTDPKYRARKQKQLKKDERRWSLADRNDDKVLTKEEYLGFILPEYTPHMRHIAFEEQLEQLDTNGDGKVSEDEYLVYGKLDGPDECAMLKAENEKRIQFRKTTDKNKDGYMDKDELGIWLMSQESVEWEVQAKKTILKADTDLDGKLTKGEILSNNEVKLKLISDQFD